VGFRGCKMCISSVKEKLRKMIIPPKEFILSTCQVMVTESPISPFRPLINEATICSLCSISTNYLIRLTYM
jgi:hypothetical protein